MELKQFAMVFVAMLVLAPAVFATYTCNSSSIVGDVNGDGQITMDDANAASYLFMHSNELPPNICCIDVAPSVGVNNGDAVKISLYVNNGGPNANTGDIGKHCYEINNQPPVITGTGGPTSLNVNQQGTWTISANDPDGTYLSYSINWGENNGATPSSPSTATTSTATFQHTYSSAGTYTIAFTVTDSAGASTQSTITVNIVGAVANQPPVIASVTGPSTVQIGQMPFWTISASDPEGSPFSISTSWGDGQNSAVSGYTAANMPAQVGHAYQTAGTYTITFTVTDSAGATAQSTATVSVQALPSCSDTDNGANLYVKGTATGQTSGGVQVAQTDYCSNQNTVVEFACSYGAVGYVTSNTFTCPSGHICQDGACVAQNPATCFDSDGGQNLFVFGYATGIDGNSGQLVNKSDTCNGQYIVDYYCHENHVFGGQTSCPANYACSDGVCVLQSANQPPVITSTGGPTSLSANQAGTWTISAYDPDGTYLTYNVVWGDEASKGMQASATFSSTATFQHAYSQAGTYTITFTVKDASGAITQSTIMVNVAGSTTSCDGFTTLYIGESMTSSGYSARLSDVMIAGAHPAVLDMLDSQGVVVGQVQIDPGQSQAFSAPNGNAYSISVCQTNSGISLNTKWAKIKMALNGGSTNQPPVITSTGGPTSLSTGASGTWKVSAYDPDGTYLTYSVNWGENGKTPSASDDVGRIGNSAAFEHAYASAGTYTIVFTVADSAGASTKSTVTVAVTDGTSTGGDVHASVGAIPTELYQYDSVYVTGKVSRGTAGASDDIRTYVVALMLDNGNAIPMAEVATAARPSGSVASIQGSSSSGISPSQGKEEQITLAPGESKEVSAYFTASQLGTNFARIMVYQKSGSVQSGYILVSSDMVKVLVKQGGIPSPPTEKITLSFEKGWNQVSVPTNYDIQLSDIQKKCDITSAWYYNTALGQYSAATTFGKGMIGVWMKANAACTYELDAPYASTWSSPLKAGWNMIGAPAGGATLASVAGDCRITSGPWNYAPSASQYAYSSKLEPGKGYWVKVASGCTLSGSDMPPAAPSEATPAGRAAATQANTPVTQSQAVEPAQSVQPAQSVRPSSAN